MNLFIAIGQHLDTMIPKAKDYSIFTQENYDKIIRYKCTYYCLEVPIMLALILCEKDTEETFQRVTHIVRDVGALYQMMVSSIYNVKSIYSVIFNYEMKIISLCLYV